MNYTNAEGMTTWGISETQVKALKTAEIEEENKAKRIEEELHRQAIEIAEELHREAIETAEREARGIEFALAHPLMKADKFRKVIATNAPCHADCWHATGDVCSCSCGGANHGIGCDPKSLLKGESNV